MALHIFLSKFVALYSFILVFRVKSNYAVSLQPGVFDVTLTPDVPLRAEFKSLYKDTPVRIVADPAINSTGNVTLSWELRYTQCEGLYGIELNSNPEDEKELFDNHNYLFGVENYISVAANKSFKIVLQPDTQPEVTFTNYTTINWSCYVSDLKNTDFKECTQGVIFDQNIQGEIPGNGAASPVETPGNGAGSPEDTPGNGGGSSEDKPENKGNPVPAGEETPGNEAGTPVETPGNEAGSPEDTPENNGNPVPAGARKRRASSQTMSKDPDALNKNIIAKVPESGSYVLLIKLEVIDGEVDSVPVTIHMKGKHGYLSAFQYQLLPFYGIMCGLYMLMGFTWLFLMCYQYKDLLGIQIWIGVVILLGLIEKAVFFGEYEHMNNYGKESALGILFPEIVSCIKRTLARLLVVVVSIGYGITRPRLGNDLNYIMAAGLTYLLLSSAEAIMRTSENYERTMVAVLPLSILDAILVWWIFRNLVDTSRVLRLRQNDTKLWLYRHFTNTLLLCVLLSVIFFVWSMKTHSLNTCIVKWQELWLDDAFWHILFCVILIVIMILFRPSVNNQRYAYSPLIDEEEEDEESKEPMLSDAYDGMKMRNLKKENAKNPVMDIADDLKWVEDNIPAAIADTALTMMDDSEDELMTNTERSKMD